GVPRGEVDVNGTTALPLGDPEALTRLHRALVVQYPYVEMVLILGMTVCPVLLALGSCLWYVFHWMEEKPEGLSDRKATRRQNTVVHRIHLAKTLNLWFFKRFLKPTTPVPSSPTSPLLNIPTELQLEII